MSCFSVVVSFTVICFFFFFIFRPPPSSPLFPYTTLFRSRPAEIAVDYRLLLRDGRWRAYDVLVDGVSFVATFRRAFGRIIQQSSYAGLVDKLRRRTVQTTDLERTATARSTTSGPHVE